MVITQSTTAKRARPQILLLRLALFILSLGLLLSACSLQENAAGPAGNDPPPVDLPPQALPNLSSALSELYTGWQAGQYSADHLPETPGLDFSGERVKVTLILLDEATAQQAIKSLPDLGAELIYSYETSVDAWVPVTALEQAAALPGISLIREPVVLTPNRFY